MKITCEKIGILALFLLLSMLLPQLAVSETSALTLRDRERGTSVELMYPDGIAGDTDFLTYYNERYGYFINIPHKVFTKVVVLPENGDGLILESKDGKARFRASGGLAEFVDGDLGDSYNQAIEALGGTNTFTYIDINRDEGSWELTWWEGNVFHHRRFIMNEEIWCDCEISYESVPREDVYDPLSDLRFDSVRSLAIAVG